MKSISHIKVLFAGLSLVLTLAPAVQAADEKNNAAAEQNEGAAHLLLTQADSPEESQTQTVAEDEAYWATHRRPLFFVNLLAFGGVLTEDADNRLTARDSRRLAGVGGILRGGAVVGDHHLLGGRLQAFFRPTRDVLDEAGMVAEEAWGVVINGLAGPEYRYITDFGLYVGASIGLGFTAGLDDVQGRCCQEGHDCQCHRDEQDPDVHAAVSLGALASVGYEFRMGRYFALYAELFGGMVHGLDEDERTMNNGIVGLAFGLGI